MKNRFNKTNLVIENKYLRSKISMIEKDLYLLKKESDLIKNSFYGVVNSRTWKSTFPIRKTVDYIKLLYCRIIRLHNYIAVVGGYKIAFIKSYYKMKDLGLKKGMKFIKLKLINNTVTENTEKDYFYVNEIDLYQKWIEINDTLTPQRVEEISNQIADFEKKPKISIIMPVYNVDIRWLKQAVESVRNQFYSNWELCISDDNSSNKDIKNLLNSYVRLDPRIKVIFRKENGHISLNSNSALELATGEWLALMDHDDLLPPNALYEIVKLINNEDNVQLIYSDEDKIDEYGMRFMPHFKSDFNLDLLYSQNYISHLGVYKTEIANKIGGFRKGFEGSQDYDFLLRYIQNININNIKHIPKILYHWRAIKGSTALSATQKSYTTASGIKALQDYFLSEKKDVVVEKGQLENTYRVRWPLVDEPLVSLIIPTYNGYQITKQAIDSILNKTTYKNFEIILVDNNSDDITSINYFHSLREHKKIKVLKYPHPFNYSAINNFAIKKAKGKIIGLINNDIEVINGDWLSEMVSHAIREDIGCVGAMLYYPNNLVQHAGVILGIGGVAGHSHKFSTKEDCGYFSRLRLVQNYSAVTAACLVMRKSVFNEVGGLNEIDLTVAFNDVDLCLKVMKCGYRNLWTPYAELYHHESISRGQENTPEKLLRFQKEVNYMKFTWGTNSKIDQFYNMNLSFLREDFSIPIRNFY